MNIKKFGIAVILTIVSLLVPLAFILLIAYLVYVSIFREKRSKKIKDKTTNRSEKRYELITLIKSLRGKKIKSLRLIDPSSQVQFISIENIKNLLLVKRGLSLEAYGGVEVKADTLDGLLKTLTNSIKFTINNPFVHSVLFSNKSGSIVIIVKSERYILRLSKQIVESLANEVINTVFNLSNIMAGDNLALTIRTVNLSNMVSEGWPWR